MQIFYSNKLLKNNGFFQSYGCYNKCYLFFLFISFQVVLLLPLYTFWSGLDLHILNGWFYSGCVVRVLFALSIDVAHCHLISIKTAVLKYVLTLFSQERKQWRYEQKKMLSHSVWEGICKSWKMQNREWHFDRVLQQNQEITGVHNCIWHRELGKAF